MTDQANRGAAVRLPPPLVYLGAIGLGALLQATLLPLKLDLTFSLRLGGALLLALLGLSSMGAAIGLFKKTGQDPKPWVSTPEIISEGIYRFSRNPMYLGMALIQTAAGVGLANGWILLLLPPVLLTIHFSAIRHEEAYLEKVFGEEYTRYKASVRRWI
ncbi:MAG: isoprenylcysteine carboxylmethyltransferase family protein [Deltaproteobacteria bacterium]|nr:isoprenylcysteine carboxylmethyltransferase family protein [Deltaproteobacteria bacterium]